MRESALFLLGLLVAVSVDVARLLVYADLCARISFASDRMYGADRPKREGAMGFTRGIRTSMNPFFRHAYIDIEKLPSISGNDTIPCRDIWMRRAISETRISIRRSLYWLVLKPCVCFVENFSRPLINAMKNAGCITKINENDVTKNMFGK